MRFKSHLITVLFVFFLLVTVGCTSKTSGAINEGNESSPDTAANTTNESTNEEPAPEGKTEVVFWHSMGGKNGKTLEKMIQDFNGSQEDIHVKPIFQGSYGDSLTKLKTSLQSSSGPTIMQSNFISSGPMIDTKMVRPIQDLIDAEGYDLSQLDQNVLSAYEMDGQLYSMPFNASTLLMYYNKDMFEENGLDPNNPPQTYEELEEAAMKLTGEGKYGASFSVDSYFLEQLFTVQGAELVNNGNGRQDLATKSFINSQEAIDTFTWWKKLVDDGLMLNLGTNTEDTHQAFLSEQVGMTLASTAGLTNMLEGSKGKFELGTAFIPYPEAKTGAGGVSVGGGSLYIMNNKSEAEQQAAWEFIKYVVGAEQQGHWYINSGYFPVNTDAYELPEVVETLAQFPQFETAINQLEVALENNAGSNAGKGPVLGVYPDARTITVEALEKVLNDVQSPKDALDEAAEEITKKIARYNQTVQ
ncbi:ABC transporter substrate-binding protein [Aquibacillus koreensis]|uniref:ABC transporter substrate-binding protein n=1 Tax=Aquibacillus koreensis TaxID=279446 RepID=A0A9X3WJR9_9BACI|nr:ABC transporter substrate-binding protein [Aquibacillus koreensis]MCT2537119.1 ABC transporter substrate-binding protein [Aquibacillus koreensis]MDC3419898.1 ABC transporter substrate-binding protein [Aquibacillus koreensis]